MSKKASFPFASTW